MSGKFLTPKAIANAIKAKGLQKLKWYCQMCEKQCRDENGFKCHQTGEAHLRQMAMFRNNSEGFMDKFSEEFVEMFMEVMRRKGGLRVLANNVYQEVIADRQHVHMSSTKWQTLGSFVQYLGKSGLCKVDQTDRGWYVQYIDRDPRVLARQEELQKRAEAAQDSEERMAEQLRRQVEAARRAEEEAKEALGVKTQEAEPTELKERNEEEKIAFNLNTSSAAAASSAASTAAATSSIATPSTTTPALSKPFSMSMKPVGVFNALAQAGPSSNEVASSDSHKRKGAPSALESLILENERLKAQEHVAKKQKLDQSAVSATTPTSSSPSTSSAASSKSHRLDYWLFPNIIVKVLNKKLLGGKLYKQKGVIQRVIDKYLAELRVTSSDDSIDGTVLQIDQDELETVIPAIGKPVQFVNGVYRGEIGVLLELNEAKYTARIRIESGVLRGKEVDGVEYEEICKTYHS